jgi:inner membrane protein
MDPLTHALLGAAVAHTVLPRRLGGRAWLIGASAALLPDADVLIRSASDPLLLIEHHRGFTHSFAFIPIGGAVAMLPWLLVRQLREQPVVLYAAATLGYATHGVLDAATTYGTRLLWPFSTLRSGWDIISIIDPLFTLVLLLGVVLGLRRGSPTPTVVALLFCLAYLGLGAVQRERALTAQQQLARERGHERARGAVFPTVGNRFAWRSLYQAGDSLYSDRVRVPLRPEARWREVDAVPLLRESELPAEVRADARMLRDFRRFHWYSDGWVALAPNDPTVIGDARYSLSTETFEPVWGIRFHPGADPPTEWVDRSRERARRR